MHSFTATALNSSPQAVRMKACVISEAAAMEPQPRAHLFKRQNNEFFVASHLAITINLGFSTYPRANPSCDRLRLSRPAPSYASKWRVCAFRWDQRLAGGSTPQIFFPQNVAVHLGLELLFCHNFSIFSFFFFSKHNRHRTHYISQFVADRSTIYTLLKVAKKNCRD